MIGNPPYWLCLELLLALLSHSAAKDKEVKTICVASVKPNT